MLVNLHDSSLVATAIAVVGCAEDCDDIPILTPVIALHHQLMRSRHECQAIVVVECFRDVLTECIAGTSGADTPSTSVIGVTPEQITHRTLMRHLLYSV
jgi:hypothetical protein